MAAKDIMNQLIKLPAGVLVECRVTRDFWAPTPDDKQRDNPVIAGEIIHLTALRAGENAQTGHVEIVTDNGRVRTIPDPDYVPPVVRTVRLRWLRSGSQYRRLDGEMATTVQGEEVEILEEGHTVFLIQPPDAERVA